MIKIDFDGCSFTGIEKVVSVSEDIKNIELRSARTTFNEIGTVFEVRDAPSVYVQLGLPAETPPDVLKEALALLQSVEGRPAEERPEALRESKLVALLSGIGGVSSLATIYSVVAPLLGWPPAV